MNCKKSRSLLSASIDGALDERTASALYAHLAGCRACAEECTELEDAARALRGLAQAPPPEHHVRAIMAAVERDADERAAAAVAPLFVSRAVAGGVRSRVASHLAAAVAGAAAALVLWMLFADGARTGTETDVSTVPPALARAERGGTAVQGRAEPDTSSADMQQATVEPRVVERVVERVIERVRFVDAPLPAFEDAAPRAADVLAAMADGLGALRLALQLERERVRMAPRLERPLAGPTDGRAELDERPQAGPDPGRDERTTHLVEPSVIEPDRERRDDVVLAALAPRRPAVGIRRDGERLTLATHGSLAQVVPALIAHLDDADPEVVDLVERRLDVIREGVLATELVPLATAEEPTEADEGRPLLRRLFSGGDSPAGAAEPEPEAERWSAWWEANALALGDPRAQGTF